MLPSQATHHWPNSYLSTSLMTFSLSPQAIWAHMLCYHKVSLHQDWAADKQEYVGLLAVVKTMSTCPAGSFLTLELCLLGFIIQAIFNFLLIILSGSRTALNMSYGEDRDVGVATYPAKTRPTSPVATNGAPQVTVVSP